MAVFRDVLKTNRSNRPNFMDIACPAYPNRREIRPLSQVYNLKNVIFFKN